jgi:threonine aldolase
VIVAREAHAVWHEAGGSAANAGVQLTEIGSKGIYTADEMIRAIKIRNGLYPPTTLIQVENTHNRMGGVIFPQDEAIRICAAARARSLATYLDGARLWNVSAETGTAPAKLTEPFDLAMVSMSKGLGAPGGSLLAGPRALISEAVRYRRMLGGAMRQVGFFAAAAEYALDHNLSRLTEDHENARMLGSMLAASPRIRHVAGRIETNILVFELTEDAPDASTIVAQARERGVLVNALGTRKIRAVTHLDAPRKACESAAKILLTIID